MNILKIVVSGFSHNAPCEPVAKTFYVRDEAEFNERVLAWEKENNVMEWHRTNR